MVWDLARWLGQKLNTQNLYFQADDKRCRYSKATLAQFTSTDGKGEKEREGLRTQFKIRLRQRKATSISRFKEQCNHSEGNQMLSAFKPCAGLNQTQKLEERGEYASSDETGEANKCHKRCGRNGMAKKS